jgi:uncharacterized Zn-finger protein
MAATSAGKKKAAITDKTCPSCHRKGMAFMAHPHAYGYKDYDRKMCRYCKAIFKAERLR